MCRLWHSHAVCSHGQRVNFGLAIGGIQTDHLIFVHKFRLAYVDAESETLSGTQIVSVSADTGVELFRVPFPTRFGKVKAFDM